MYLAVCGTEDHRETGIIARAADDGMGNGFCQGGKASALHGRNEAYIRLLIPSQPVLSLVPAEPVMLVFNSRRPCTPTIDIKRIHPPLLLILMPIIHKVDTEGVVRAGNDMDSQVEHHDIIGKKLCI